MPAKRPISPPRVEGKWPNFPPLRRDNELVVARYTPMETRLVKGSPSSRQISRVYVLLSPRREKFILSQNLSGKERTETSTETTGPSREPRDFRQFIYSHSLMRERRSPNRRIVRRPGNSRRTRALEYLLIIYGRSFIIKDCLSHVATARGERTVNHL